MLFKSLNPLLAGVASLSLILTSGSNGEIHVAVIPVPKKDGNDAAGLKEPLSITATPEELDEKFPELVAKYTGARSSLEDQLEATLSVLEAAKKDAATKASTAVKKGAAKPVAKPAVAVPGLTAAAPDGQHDGEDDQDPSGTDTPPGVAPAAAVENNLFA
jgi:PRTRC genetic system protein E